MKKSYIFIPLVTLLVAIGGSMLTNLGMSWYATLVLNPATPAWSFIGTARTLIFIYTMCSALYFRKNFPRGKKFTTIARLFIANAVLNVWWSLIFFVGHFVLFSIIEMIVLWIVTFLLFILMYRKAKISSWLLLPYLIWVIVATYLAYQVLILN